MNGWLKRIRDTVLVCLLLSTCFGAGWYCCGQNHIRKGKVQFDFAKGFVVPASHVSITIAPRGETEHLTTGDRIDVWKETDGDPEPLILDAIVTFRNNRMLGMLFPRDGLDVLLEAQRSSDRLIFRPTVVTTDPSELKQTAR